MQDEHIAMAGNGATGTVEKAFQILGVVTAGPDRYATVSDIAEKLSLPRPTANRLVNNLIKLGILKRDGGGSRIIEGERLIEIAGAVLEGSTQRGPRHEILRQLVIETRETANIGTISGGELLYLDRVEAIWPLAFHLNVGSRVPIYCSAIGKLLLSRMPPKRRAKYLDSISLSRRTENTICDRGALETELDRIRQERVATDNEECFHGVIGIAVPIGDGRTVPSMGLALVAPSGRQTLAQLQEFLPTMMDAAARLARCYQD